MRKPALLLATLASSFLTGQAAATIIHVPSDRPNLQAGIDAALPGDTVLVADGTYTGPGNRDIDFGGRDVVLRSVNGPQATTIDCQGTDLEPHRGFAFHSSESSAATVEGFTIQNGYAHLGGAILCSNGSSPTIAGNVIIDNQDPNGGGGGICCNSSDPILVGNVLLRNTADDGGAISLINSSATISYNVMARNNTPNEGGALSMFGSSPTMESNTIVCNTAGYGGGGMFLYNSSPTLVDCIVSFNHGVGGILCSASGTNNNPELFCCNVFGNEMGDWTGCIAGQAVINDNFSLDPVFCDTFLNDFHLYGTSPCAPSNNSCGVLVGALDVDCYAPKALIEPDTLYAFMQHTIDPMFASIACGDFSGGYSVVDVDATMILINGSVVPTMVTVIPNEPPFGGDILLIEAQISEILSTYGVLWGTVNGTFQVSGQFLDSSEFSVSGNVVLRGHVLGDANLDGTVNVADISFLVSYLFLLGPRPPLQDVADLNCDSYVTVTDIGFLATYLFLGGPVPVLCP